MCIAFSTLWFAPSALAGDVVKWVDANGVTHFGNAQFAPEEGAEQVELQEANAMDAPDTGVLRHKPSARPLNGVVVERQQVKNPRGWRGYWGRRVEPKRRHRH